MPPPDLRVLHVDPALFGAHYDAAFSRALTRAGVAFEWVTQPLREGEPELPGLAPRRELFYRGEAAASVRHAGAVAKIRKGLSHVAGARRLLRYVRETRPDVVHFQWAVVPFIDRMLMHRLQRWAPVVFTVHDLSPYNASASSRLQMWGFRGVLKEASALVVHTRSTRQTLVASGLPADRVVHIPHGPMRLSPEPPRPAAPWAGDRRWRIVLFGKLQQYKGIDILIEALGRLAPSILAGLEVVIAGEPFIDMAPIETRVVQLGLQGVVTFQLKRLTDAEVHALLESADAYIFPYRDVEASGVLYLILDYARWIVASDLGAFRDLIEPGVNGVLVPPRDVEALASAIHSGVGRRPQAVAGQALPTWDDIAQDAKRLYQRLASQHRAR